jgi:hypothetical protein
MSYILCTLLIFIFFYKGGVNSGFYYYEYNNLDVGGVNYNLFLKKKYSVINWILAIINSLRQNSMN